MKSQVFKLTLLLILFLTYLGCSSDSDPDPCEIIPCQNGGVFVDCTCDCPEGYTGTDCSIQVTPLSITITKVTLNLFPLTDSNGNTWDSEPDPDARPDVYFKLVKGSSIIIYDSPTFFENAVLGNNQVFTLTSPIIITDLISPYIIGLFDYDANGNDPNIAEQAFFIYDNDNDFPSSMIIEDQAQPIRVTIDLTYQF